MQRIKLNQRGFTLLEFTILLILVAVLVAAILIMAASVSRNSKENDAAQGVMYISKTINGLWGTRNMNIGAMDTQNLIIAKAFPEHWIDRSVTPPVVRNPWNGNVEVYANNASKTFEINFQGVPTASCIELATNNVLAPQEVGLNTFTAGNRTWNSTQLLQPITPADAAASTACANGATVGMGWHFNVRG